MVLIHRQNAIREFIDGEAHVKGFLLAYLGLTQGYILLPEYESSKGYADFYMMPDLVRQPDIVYSYIVEVKYARRDTSDADIALLKRDAAELITLVFKGWELVALEKLASRADCENASEA